MSLIPKDLQRYGLSLLLASLLLWLPGFLTAQPTERDKIATSQGLDSFRIEKALNQTKIFYLQFPDSAFAIYTYLLKNSLAQHYRKGTIRSLLQLGNLSYFQGNYDKAANYYKMGIHYCDTQVHRSVLITLYTNLGSAYNNQSLFESAYKNYEQAAYYARDSVSLLVPIHANLGTILAILKQYKKALFYIDRALENFPASGNLELKAVLLQNKGNCYFELKDYTQSSLYIDSAIHLSRKHDLKREIISALIESSRLDLVLEKPGRALNKMLEAINLCNNPGIPALLKSQTVSIIGLTYLKLNKYKEAEKYLQWGWETTVQQPNDHLLVLEGLATLYATTQNYQKAYRFQQDFLMLKDSLHGKEVALSINEIETKYRTSEKDKELAQKRLQITEQQKRIAQKNSWIWAITSGALLTIILLLWRYFYVHQKNRKLESKQEIQYLKAVMEGEQKERVRIATELHDGIVSELTTLKMNLVGIPYYASDHPRDFYHGLQQLNESINDVRNTAHNLMPEILLRYDLTQAIQILCANIEKTGRLRTEFQHYGDFTQLSMELRQSVYRIVQELLHNVIKHAQASKALIQLSCYDQLLTATIEDDGIGMDRASKKQNDGIGLANMEQRVKQLNGAIEWNHTPSGTGTNVYLQFEL